MQQAMLQAANQAFKSDRLASRRLGLLKELKGGVSQLKDNLVEESQQRAALERLKDVRFGIKKKRVLGGGAAEGGGLCVLFF